MSKDKSLLRPNYYSGLTLAFIPCDKVDGYGDYTVSDECIRNETQQLEYVNRDWWGYFTTYLYYNYEYFDSELYGDQSIQRFSRVSEFYFDPSKPKWFDFDY